MNKQTDKCPHCGENGSFSDIYGIRRYKCGTSYITSKQSDLCREREARQKAEAEVARLESLVKELKENAERIGCNRFERLCKAEAKNRDLLETLAAIYEKLGIKEENVKPKELVSDTIANLFKEKTNEVAKLRRRVKDHVKFLRSQRTQSMQSRWSLK